MASTLRTCVVAPPWGQTAARYCDIILLWHHQGFAAGDAELQAVLVPLEQQQNLQSSQGASPGLVTCLSASWLVHGSDQSSRRRLVHSQVSERSFLFLRSVGVVVEWAIHRPERQRGRQRVSGGRGVQVDHLHRWADTHLPCSGCPWNVAECGSAGLRCAGAWWWPVSTGKLDCWTAPRVLRLPGRAPPPPPWPLTPLFTLVLTPVLTFPLGWFWWEEPTVFLRYQSLKPVEKHTNLS